MRRSFLGEDGSTWPGAYTHHFLLLGAAHAHGRRLGCGGFGGGVDGVADEVDEHLLEPHGIGPHRQICRHRVGDHCHAGLASTRLNQHQRLADGFVHRHGCTCRIALARERLDVRNDAPHALGKLADVREIAAHFVDA
uniref:hypothetical protein n=1 Tax=Streptomyces clavuligerus TaxID=1901 RepID=UPI0018D1B77D